MVDLSALRVSRLRAWGIWRRRLCVPFLFLPAASVVLFDFLQRGAGRFARFEAADYRSYGQALLLSACLWCVLLLASSRRRGALRWVYVVAFLFFLSASLGGQAYFFQQNNAYMNFGVARFATQFSESVVNQLREDWRNYASFMIPAAVFSALVFALARKWLRPRRRVALVAQLLAPVLLYLALTLPQEHARRQPCPPDLLYTEAIGETLRLAFGLSKNSGRDRPRLRESLELPRLEARPARPRNVVFVISESVRKDATCNAYEQGCQRTAATNKQFPQRFPLEQMRALDSCTAISMAVLWSGLGPHEDRDALHSWPLLFDYARHAGYFTAYWTSQNLMFGNMRLWVKNLGVDDTFSALDVDPESHIDLGVAERLFAERAESQVAKLKEPYFLTIQLSNGHYPYLVEEDGPQPFQPATTNKAPSKNREFFNHYQNAIYQEDLHLARVLRAIRKAPGGERTVIVYTSDHGEAFREHGQMGHTFSLHDEEVHVPAWIDAPEGTLSSEEKRALGAKRDAFTFHPDLTATVLDLLGVWNNPAVARIQSRILGRSLLRPEFEERSFPMTNCAAVWSCAFENWGYMRGPRKLTARAWDFSYHCYDISEDPKELTNLKAPACGELNAQADATFGRLPGKQK